MARILPWAQADHIAIHRCFDGGGRSDFGHERPADEHQREIFEHDVGRGVCGTARRWRPRPVESPEEEPKSAVAANGAELASVALRRTTASKRAEVDVVVVIELAG